MNAICVDDEYLILQRSINILKKLPQVEDAKGFQSGLEALEYMEDHEVDIVFLDINMPEIGGMELAKLMRQKYPDLVIVFLTAYNQFAVNAFKIRANGYLMKPVEKEDFEEEIKNAQKLISQKAKKLITVKTFGNFEVLINNNMISFSRRRAKEILAYLICKKGTGVSRPELATIFWEDAQYDRSKQKQLDVYIRSLITTLKENNVEEIIDRNNGLLRIRSELLDCDYYKYLDGIINIKEKYHKEFMHEYSWAEYMNPFL